MTLMSIGALPAWASSQACIPGHGMSDAALQDLHFEDYRREHPAAALPQGSFALGRVRFFRQNVFPHRTHLLARMANRLNTLTTEGALRAAFPINDGGTVDESRLYEAERVLRNKPYLYDAVVVVRWVCGAVVDIDVVVRDVWTLTPGVGVSRQGGDNKTIITLSDVNLLGRGKGLSVEYVDDRDRTGTYVSYSDPNIRGSRWNGRVVVADNDDGDRYRFDLYRPFFALDTPVSFGVSLDQYRREQDLEFLSRDRYEVDARTESVSAYAAFSAGRESGWVNRTYIGVRLLDEEFEFSPGFPGSQRTSRRFTYPYVGWSLFQDQFIQGSDVNRVGIIEDIQLGWSSYAELGWAPHGIGNESSTLLGRVNAAYNRYLGDAHLLSVGANLRGRYDLNSGATQDLYLGARGAYLWQQAPQWRMLVSLQYDHTRGLPLEKQLTLGGESGLRGYPSRYQIGDRSWAMTLEQRYYSGAYPFGLFRVGYAIFADVGQAWFHDSAPEWVPHRRGDHFGLLGDVGLGLRLESVRTRRDRVLHLDLSKPLVEGPDVDGWEFTATAKTTF